MKYMCEHCEETFNFENDCFEHERNCGFDDDDDDDEISRKYKVCALCQFFRSHKFEAMNKKGISVSGEIFECTENMEIEKYYETKYNDNECPKFKREEDIHL